MTYQEIKDRLVQCELTLIKIKNGTHQDIKNINVEKAVKKLEVLKESYMKILKEASEKTYLVTPKSGKTAALSLGDDEVDALKDADDIEKIKSSDGQEVKEQEGGVKFSVEETKSIAKKVGQAVAKALKGLGDEVAHMKAKQIEENSFEIYVEYKNGSDDQFSFYIVEDSLHLVDFSFDKEISDVGVKPSGEAVVNVDVVANELTKHFRSLQEKINEAPEGKLYIKVAVRDARKALAIIDDSPAYSKAVEMDGSDTYYLTDEELAYDLLMDFGAHDIEVTDNNIEMDEASDYARRRAAERDYQPSKRDVPPKKYKEPKNDYFARRKAEDDYVQENISQEVVNKVSRFVTSMANHYDYSEQDAVYAIMQALRAHKGNFDGLDEDIDVGHQDDEPNMLKKDLYDVITYAAKLYKQLDKYDQHDGEVDFPHWWQKKVTLAREYMSAAQHYLEGEEKQPAIDQLALENASAEEENKFHKKLDTLVHKTFGKREDEKVMKEDWGSSDQYAMNQSIHKDLGEPKSMPSPFSQELESAVESAVDFYWDDWEEYQTDRDGLIDHAKKAYLRAYFKDTFNKMVQMFSESKKDIYGKFLDNPSSPKGRAKSLILKFTKEYGDDASSMAVDRFAKQNNLKPEEKYILKYITKNNITISSQPGGPDFSAVSEASVPKIQKAHGLVVAKMKELAKVYKNGDTSVIAQLKDLTAKKKQLEKQLEKAVAGTNRNQQLDPNGIDENLDRYLESAVRDLVDSHAATAGLSDQAAAEEMMEFIGQEYGVNFEFGAGPSRMEEQPIQEEKATYCGRCKTTHKKSSGCPKK